jgi:TRAP-type C4-dicarboxylate transport system substrate-binding protein
VIQTSGVPPAVITLITGETSMLKRRTALGASLALPFIRGAHAEARNLNISHQFPGSDGDTGDFRDRMCRRFAAEVQKRTNGALTFTVFPNASLVKTFAQISALRKGALDVGLVPTAYGGGEIPELNVTFMPAVVDNYETGLAWRRNAIGKAMNELLDAKGIKLITWLWQSGAIAARGAPILRPADAKGLKIRGGSKEMDEMFQAAGAATSTMPSNELYMAMKTGVMDAAVTSSTSLISFHLEETCKNLTSAQGSSFFYVLEPILMSKAIFESLPADQQKIMLEVGESLEPWGLEQAKADDAALDSVFEKAGIKATRMTPDMLLEWRDLARDSAWKGYASKSASCVEFLKMAGAVKV